MAARGRWIAGALVAGLLVASALAVRAAELGAQPTFRPGGPASDRQDLGPALQLAGSGACLPLVRDLAAGLAHARPGAALVVHESIGTTGGVRAAAEGAIDVGLASRPLADAERALGLRVEPFARVPVVVIAHAGVPDRALSPAGLTAIFAGERDRWEGGQPIVVLLRERGDSAQAAVGRVLPDFAAAVEASLSRDRFRVLYHDQDLVRAVERTPGAIGISDAVQAARAEVRVLPIAGGVGFHRDLSFVARAPADPRADALVAYARSPEGRAVLIAAGAQALPEGP